MKVLKEAIGHKRKRKSFCQNLYCRFSRKWQTRRLQNHCVRRSRTTAHSQITPTTVTSIKNPRIRGLRICQLLQKMATLFQQLPRSICSKSGGATEGQFSLAPFVYLLSTELLRYHSWNGNVKSPGTSELWNVRCKPWNISCETWNCDIENV